MKHILVAEDEAAIREFVVINLKRAGYDVYEANDGEQALKLFEELRGDVDVALLDIMMPGIDGLEVCREFRQRNPNIGIIMLTARAQEADRVTGLMQGADDYVTKPFSPSELVARVDALYRRVATSRPQTPGGNRQEIESGIFVLNLRSRTLSKAGVLIELTHVEFQIMEYFIHNPSVALSRTEILTHVWGDAYAGEEKIVDVNIRRLRMKIEDDASSPKYVLTVWGIGYRWQP